MKTTFRGWFAAALLICLLCQAIALSFMVTGKVTSKVASEAMPGITLLKNTRTSSYTNENGTFSNLAPVSRCTLA